ncbi:hypothetical protein [Bdellovibrio sp. NC01]|uniref:hypothetical protein n=1 Tax=Bdellovibrio sp. NC01 TaxID=2220073 RepID=UPI0011577442|nr:hypothetical protein [Bdellovibrio sp. NC01]QDK38346.1 hypothetical protein DOE51_12525 [Bdellovibrio sp. NC01]
MKFLIILTLTFISTMSFALGGGGSAGGSGNSISRDELLKLDRKYDVNVPVMQMQGRAIGVTGICVSGEYARTIEPIKTDSPLILSRNNGPDKVLRVDSKEEILTQPLTEESVDCLDYRNGYCVRYDRSLKTLPTSFEMDVRDYARGRQSFGRLLYKVKYQLPNCE